MSIKRDQYTVIEYTRCEAAAIKTKARIVMDVKCSVTFGLHFTTQTRWTASFTFLSLPFIEAHVRYDLTWFPCTIQSDLVFVYNTIWMCSDV